MPTHDQRTKRTQRVSYVLRSGKKGGPVFSDLRLPDGTIVRSVDRTVHERALRRVTERFKEPAE